jgi:hypothetical protein
MKPREFDSIIITALVVTLEREPLTIRGAEKSALSSFNDRFITPDSLQSPIDVLAGW